MALVKSTMEEQFKLLFAPATMPGSIPDAAAAWASAVDVYGVAVTPPSLTSAQAKAAFEAAMLGVSPVLKNGIVQLVVGFTAYATALAGGMAPAFTGAPPATPINIVPVVTLGLAGGSGDQCAALFATIVDVWFRTGLAVNNSSGATIPWS